MLNLGLGDTEPMGVTGNDHVEHRQHQNPGCRFLSPSIPPYSTGESEYFSKRILAKSDFCRLGVSETQERRPPDEIGSKRPERDREASLAARLFSRY